MAKAGSPWYDKGDGQWKVYLYETSKGKKHRTLAVARGIWKRVR